MRRGFIDPATKGGSPIPAKVLTRIAALYRIGGEIVGLPAEALRPTHEERSRPLLTAIERFLQGKLAPLSHEGTLAVAIRHAMSHWDGLTPYLDDDRVATMSSATVCKALATIVGCSVAAAGA